MMGKEISYMSLTYEQIWIRFHSLVNALINAYKEHMNLQGINLFVQKAQTS